MDRLAHKLHNQKRRANRVRKLAVGTSDRPRLSVHFSNLHITAQVIDDSTGQTVAYATTIGSKTKITGSMTEKANFIGTEIAKKAMTAKVNKVVFDRGSKLFHGRVRALAEAARKEGLEF